MAIATGAEREREAAARSCGSCSLCCTLLRVDELGKLGGQHCVQQRLGHPEGGCAIHASRPQVCRGYRCLWLQGGLGAADRPDRLGAVLDLVTEGETSRLVVHEERRGALERSPRLQEIVAEWRESLPVRVIAVEDVLKRRPAVPHLASRRRRRARGRRAHHLLPKRGAPARGALALARPLAAPRAALRAPSPTSNAFTASRCGGGSESRPRAQALRRRAEAAERARAA